MSLLSLSFFFIESGREKRGESRETMEERKKVEPGPLPRLYPSFFEDPYQKSNTALVEGRVIYGASGLERKKKKKERRKSPDS